MTLRRSIQPSRPVSSIAAPIQRIEPLEHAPEGFRQVRLLRRIIRPTRPILSGVDHAAPRLESGQEGVERPGRGILHWRTLQEHEVDCHGTQGEPKRSAASDRVLEADDEVASHFVGNFDGRSFRLILDYPYSIPLRHQAAFLS